MDHVTSFPLRLALATVIPVALTACSAMTHFDDAIAENADFGGVAAIPESPALFDESTIVPDGTTSDDGLVVKDITTNALPVDPFLVKDTGSIDKVRQLFLSSCMREKGSSVTLPTVRFDTDEPRNPAIAANSGQMIFTPENAGKYGYYYNSVYPNNGVLEFNAAVEEIYSKGSGIDQSDGATNTDPDAEALAACEEALMESEQDLYGMDSQGYDSKESYEEGLKRDPLGAMYYYTGTNTAYVKRTTDAWKTCMAPLGIADLPDSPLEMPPASLDEHWYNNQVDTNPMTHAASAEELSVAKADATCRESSGYNRAMYDVSWSMLQDYVNENKDILLEELKNRQSIEQKRQEYISSHLN
ncbi:hypothetical protein [Stomatohabitans albus]|uniref:hypothetical protein n=1 Tax=Stomatohabitans albus TaxID=3110766 RepID=UPI00300D4900